MQDTRIANAVVLKPTEQVHICAATIKLYRRVLTLNAKYSDTKLVPDKIVTVWMCMSSFFFFHFYDIDLCVFS